MIVFFIGKDVGIVPYSVVFANLFCVLFSWWYLFIYFRFLFVGGFSIHLKFVVFIGFVGNNKAIGSSLSL